MGHQNNLLNVLRIRTTVDCDTLDVTGLHPRIEWRSSLTIFAVPKELGQFADCTSNQTIAHGELQKSHHQSLLRQCVGEAERILEDFHGVGLNELAVEISMIRLSLRIAPHISGYVHTQTNPIKAYDTEATVANALRIKTLATTLFTFEQGALAGQVGCQYIAPYVHELKVQTSPGHVDRSPNNALCVLLQRYYSSRSLSTKVLAASLTSVEEVMALAGIDHITLPPPLLKQLVNSPLSDKQPSLFDQRLDDEQSFSLPLIETKDDFDRALRMSKGGDNQRKLDQVSSFRFTSSWAAKNPIF
ncbi:MAG: hypothetical protein Q9181_002510 [Wetmoreana brouardii]